MAHSDFDQNPDMYLLENIQNYHTSAAAMFGMPPSFTLPACVSKAQYIVDAVAHFNSSLGSRACEPSRSADDKGSVNTRAVTGEVEPSVHWYVSRRDIRGCGEIELQESVGSSTLSGNMWMTSCESTDRM
jgi:hypothetical protein